MNKEKWIDEVLQSAKGIQPVESNPYLASKVEARLQTPSPNKISLRWVYATAAIMLVILTVNVAAWRHTATNNQSSPVQQLVHEYDLSNHDFYSINYSN
jgi:hypothetical protein